MLKHWELIAGMVALGAGFWGQLKGLLKWLKGFLISSRRTDSTLARMIISHVTKSGRRHSRQSPWYGTSSQHVKPLGRVCRVIFEDGLHSGTQIFWFKGRPIVFTKDPDNKGPDGDASFTFSFIRGTLDWDEFLISIHESDIARKEFTAYREIRHRVRFHFGKTFAGVVESEKNDGKKYEFTGWSDAWAQRLLKWSPDDIGGTEDGMGKTFILAEELEKIADEIRVWFKNRKWYERRRVPWRRGYMLHGIPGTGKTTFIREIAKELDLPIHVMDLASMSNEDLQKAWGEALKETPCVVLIEDIDGVFNGRENVASAGMIGGGGGLTIDRLLNCIDGVERANGILLAITTNKLELVDPAVLRPGRIDRTVEVRALDLDCRRRLAMAVLDDRDAAEQLAGSIDDAPASVFMEMCCREALNRLFSEQEKAEALSHEQKEELPPLKREVG